VVVILHNQNQQSAVELTQHFTETREKDCMTLHVIRKSSHCEVNSKIHDSRWQQFTRWQWYTSVDKTLVRPKNPKTATCRVCGQRYRLRCPKYWMCSCNFCTNYKCWNLLVYLLIILCAITAWSTLFTQSFGEWHSHKTSKFHLETQIFQVASKHTKHDPSFKGKHLPTN